MRTRATLRKNARKTGPSSSANTRRTPARCASCCSISARSQVVEEKTSDPANYARIGVEDVKSPQAAGTQIEVVTPKKVYSLIVGQARGYEVGVRARRGRAEELRSPRRRSRRSRSEALARSARVPDIPESRVKEVAVTPASGPAYTVSREKKEQTDFTVTNVPKGRELSSPGAGNAVAGDLTSLQLDDVRHARARMRSPPGASSTPRSARSMGSR